MTATTTAPAPGEPSPLGPAFSGWLSLAGADGSRAAEIAATFEGLPGPAMTARFDTPDCFVAAHGAIHADPETGLVAVIAGLPRWTEDDLAVLAREQGNAAALATAARIHGDKLGGQMAGHFAAAVMNRARGTVTLLTDRLGRIPVYYCQQASGIFFSTTGAPIATLSSGSSSIAPQALYNYVYFHMVPAPDTIFAGVRKLRAASRVTLDGVVSEPRRYWLPSFRETCPLSRQEMHGHLRESLRNAVANAVPPNSRVGAFLSGGLDSSTVAGLLSELQGGTSHAYAIGFDAEGYDEMEYARITARHFGINLHEYYVTPDDVVEALPVIATRSDEPFGNSSALPAWFCARMAAKDGIETLLAGDGGDELFAGNERYAKQKVFEHYHTLPRWLRRGMIEPLAGVLPANAALTLKAGSYLRQANTPLPDRLQVWSFLHRNDPRSVFESSFLDQIRTEYPMEVLRETYHAPAQTDAMNRMLYLDWQITLADNDLRKVNQACALAGVDVCYPMLDDELVAFSTTVPSDWKLPGQRLRHFYKEALTGWLPRETIEKRKHGFGLPFGVWMRDHKPLRDLAYENILEMQNRRIFQPRFLETVISKHRHEHAAYYGSMIWTLLVLELWLKTNR